MADKSEVIASESIRTALRPTSFDQHYEASTPQERALDKRIDLKLDLIVVVLLSFCFLFQGIDRSNIGYAATTTFIKDAHLKPDDVPNAVSLYSATYVTLQPFSTVMGRRVGPKWWISSMMIIWGALSIAHCGIKNTHTLIALRLLLGAAEAGFVQTSLYYLSTLYPKYKYGFRSGLFSGMYSVAGAFAGLIAYGMLQIQSSVLKGWQVLFIFEGSLTILLGIVIIFVLPAHVGNAWFLSDEERRHAVRRLKLDIGDIGLELESKKVTMRDWLDALKDWKKLGIVLFNICGILPVSAFSTFLPLVVQGMGYHGVRADLMAVPPFVVGAVGLWVFVRSSDHFRERSLHIVGGMGLALIGLIVMTTSSDPKLRYGFTHVCLAGAFVCGPLVAAWLASNTPNKATRAVILGFNGYSNIAGVIAGQLFKAKYAPSYKFPLKITMILTAVGMVGYLAIRGAYMLTNRKRLRQMATLEDPSATLEDPKRRDDQRIDFIYGY